MRKFSTTVITVILLAGLVWLGVYAWRVVRGVLPVIREPSQDITDVVPGPSRDAVGGIIGGDAKNPVQGFLGKPLTLPDGFSISIFAKGLPGARVMAFDALGNMWVSQTREGRISLLEIENDMVVRHSPIFAELRKPHGLAFAPNFPSLLYFAEEDKISKVATYSDGPPEKLIDLPTGERHFTRTLGFGPDGRLFVSIGSSCDVCEEEDPRLGTISSLRENGTDFKEFAKGLRNAVFFITNPVDGKLWATEMGRDWLGDDLPPDEINIVEEGKNYGWPFCYGNNIQDLRFDSSQRAKNICASVEPSFIDIPAHSAPLGLSFIPESTAWPEEYWYDLLVAYHGSWNRSVPTGYKVVRHKFDAEGNYQGVEDFISGWLRGDEALGRPADIIVSSDGAIYVSDDKAGVIYKVIYEK